MEITEVKIFLIKESLKKLKGFASITFDNVFVVKNIKIIEDATRTFIVMPSRKTRQLCSKCGFRNEVHSKFCNQCAEPLPLSENKEEHRDIAHPITKSFKEYMEQKILEAYGKAGLQEKFGRKKYAK